MTNYGVYYAKGDYYNIDEIGINCPENQREAVMKLLGLSKKNTRVFGGNQKNAIYISPIHWGSDKKTAFNTMSDGLENSEVKNSIKEVNPKIPYDNLSKVSNNFSLFPKKENNQGEDDSIDVFYKNHMMAYYKK